MIRFECDVPYDAIEVGGRPEHYAAFKVGGQRDVEHICHFHAVELLQNWAASASLLALTFAKLKDGATE